MMTRKKITFWTLGIVCTLVVVALALVLLAPSLLETEALKGRLQTALLEKTGGKLDYQSAEFNYFPLPKLELHQLDLSLPVSFTGRAKRLTAYPDLLALLSGNVRFKRLILEEPDLAIGLVERTELPEEKPDEPSAAAFYRALMTQLAPFALLVPELKLEIRDGKLRLEKQKQHLLSAENLNLKLNFFAADASSFQAGLQGSVPDLTIFRKAEKVVISGNRLKGSIQGDQDKLSVVLTELDLTQPQLAVTGTFSASRTDSDFVLEVAGKNVDVDSTRETALALLGEFPVARAIFNIIRGGTVPHISFATRGETLAELGSLDNILITGQMQDGKIFVPGVDLPLEETNGDVVIAGGILEGKKLSARLEQSRGELGDLKIGLRGGDAPFHLELMIDADLSQLLPILERVVDNRAFVAELKRITNLQGKGRGKLILGESLQSVEAKVEVEELQLTADYQRIPFPVDIKQGQFSFAESQVGIKNLAGTVGASSFANLSYRIYWQEELSLDITSGRFDLALAELYPWAASFAAVLESLAGLEDAKGRLELSDLKLKGPVNKPGQWRFEAAGQVKEVTLQTTFLPELVYLRGGNFQAIPNQLSMQNVQARVLDAALDLSGILRGVDNGELSLSGNMGPKAAGWLRNYLELEPGWVVHTPLNISGAELKWQPEAIFSVQGDVAFPKGPKISGELFYSPEEFSINQLHVDDNESAATLSFSHRGNRVELEFLGSLQKNIFDDIFVAPPLAIDWLAGNIQARIVMDRPEQSTAQGELSAGNILLPLKSQGPLLIERIAVSSQGNRIDIDDSVLSWGKQKADIQGGVSFAAEGYLLDLDVATGTLQWKDIDRLVVAGKEKKRPKSGKQPWELPVSGEIRVSAESFSWRHYSWKPVRADVSIRPETLGIKINQAQLCGISTPGSLTANSEGLTLDFQVDAKDQNLASSYACLTENRVNMTGSFDLTGNIKAQGQVDELLNFATGSLAFNARKGRITKHKLFSRILEIINITEVYKGKFPSLARTGFPYDATTAKGLLKDGNFFLNEFHLDGETMEMVGKGEFDLGSKTMDVKLLLEPLKTIDTIIKMIPGVNYLLAGSLISIPVSATGDISAPRVTVLSPLDIGSGLLNFAERVLKVPLKIIEPILPATESE